MTKKRWLSVVVSVGGIVVVVVTVCFVVTHWSWLSDGDSPAATIRNLGVVLASAIALPLAIWRSTVAHRQAETQRRGLLNERYQRGADMLGDGALSVRLGGIYALERLAEEHVGDYHVQVMSVLSAFVRYPPNDNIARGESKKNGRSEQIREDVRAILDFWRRRRDEGLSTEDEAQYRIDLRGADLNGAFLDGTTLLAADMSYTNLGRANLSKARVAGALFIGATMKGAQLVEADLSKARFDNADLEKADFSGTILANADLTGSRGLTQAQLDVAKVTDESPDLTGLKDASTGAALVWGRDSV